MSSILVITTAVDISTSTVATANISTEKHVPQIPNVGGENLNAAFPVTNQGQLIIRTVSGDVIPPASPLTAEITGP